MEIREFHTDKLCHIPSALKEVLDDLCNRVVPEQESSRVPWDYIRAEIWEDSGRVIFFPASSTTEDRIDVSANFIQCNELLDIVNDLDDSELSDNEHEEKFESLINNIAKMVNSFFSKQHEFTLRCFNQDSYEIKT